MKRWIGAFCLALSFTVSLQAAVVIRPSFEPRFSGAEIGEWTMDLDSALAQAREGTNNVIVLFTGAWWCPHCQVLESQVLSQTAWHEYAVSNRFYLVMMDFPGRADQYWCWLRETNYVQNAGLTLEQGEAELARRYTIQTDYAVPGAASNTINGVTYARVGYPTMIVLRPDGTRLGRFTPLASTVSMDMVLRNINQLLAADATDEKDDYYQGATVLETPLCDDWETLAAAGTLSESDLSDWYAFDATAGVQWSFACRPTEGVPQAGITARIYSDPTNAVRVAEQTVALTNNVLSYVVPQTGRYWLELSQAAVLTNRIGYTLSYWYGTPPASVMFAQSAVSVSERAKTLTLTVNISDAAAAADIHVRYETFAGSASPGEDYVETAGELVWTAGIKRAKTISIPLISDSVWEGDETFGVRLVAVKNCAVGDELATCLVTLKEATQRKAGKLSFDDASPRTLVEGVSALFQVVRTDGTDGSVTASVVRVDGRLREPVAELVWGDQETAAKSFSWSFTNEPGYQADQSSVLLVVPSGGASLVSSSAGTVKLTRRDDGVVQTFAEFAAQTLVSDFGVKATKGVWFYGLCADDERPEAWLRCEPVSPRSSSSFGATLTGPGVLTFDWRLEGTNALFQFALGSSVLENLTEAGTETGVTVAVPPRSQKPIWTVRSLTAGTDLVFGGVRNWTWTPLPQAAEPLPLDRAAVINRQVSLCWVDLLAAVSWPAGVQYGYALYAGTSSSRLSKMADLTEARFPRSANADDQAVFDALIEQANGKTIYWRVDTVATDLAGRRIVNTGSVWSLTILPEGAPEFVAAEGGYDPGETGSVVLPEQTIGVMSEIGPFAIDAQDGDTVKATVKNGKLPTGTQVEIRDGALWIVGAPKQTGTGSVDLCLTARRLTDRRTTTVAGTSLNVTWGVRSLGRAAGQFDGYRVTENDTPGCGSTTLSVAGTGGFSGKVVVNGLVYSFRGAAFDGLSGAVYIADTVAKAGTNQIALTVRVAEDGGGAEIVSSEGDGAAQFALWRNNWKDDGMDAVITSVIGYYTVALPITTSNSSDAPQGTGYLTVTVKKGGTVTYAGAMGDGKSVSGTAPLLYGPDCCSAEDRFTFYMYTVPSGYGTTGRAYGLFHLLPGVDKALPNDNTVESADQQGFFWINENPKSVDGYDPETGLFPNGFSGFSNVVDVVGGFYDKTVSLQTFYAGHTLEVSSVFMAPDNFKGVHGESPYTLLSLPDSARLPVSVLSATALAAPSVVLVKTNGLVDTDQSSNPWGFSVKWVRQTGLFSGSFKAYYQGQTAAGMTTQSTKTLLLKGVFIPCHDVEKLSSDWMGYYLIPDTSYYEDGYGRQKNYSFNWSVPFAMGTTTGSD